MDYYNQIADILSKNCPAEYSKAWIEAEVKDDWSKQRVWCTRNEGKTQPDLTTLQTSEIDEALHEIRKSMIIPGQAPWSRCTFTLFPDGKFKFDVEYDD